MKEKCGEPLPFLGEFPCELEKDHHVAHHITDTVSIDGQKIITDVWWRKRK